MQVASVNAMTDKLERLLAVLPTAGSPLPNERTVDLPRHRVDSRARSARAWLSTRHSLRIEAIVVLAFYAVYEASRALVAGEEQIAIRHAHSVVALERSLHVFVEHDIQRAAHAVPGLVDASGVVYLTLHLAVTGGYLLWLHQRRPYAFAIVRSTLLIASGLALVGYVLLPTAPPRLAGIGIADTVSNTHIDLNEGLISSLYNPVAAIPSMHFGYALVVGVSLLHCGERAWLRVVGALYPPVVVLVIVATGNHFLLDAAAGALTVGVAYGVAVGLRRTSSGSMRMRRRFAA
jgi:PAP2 superfamily